MGSALIVTEAQQYSSTQIKRTTFFHARMLQQWNIKEMAVLVSAEKMILGKKNTHSSELLHSRTKTTPKALRKQIKYSRLDSSMQSVSMSLRSTATESLVSSLFKASNFRSRGPKWFQTAPHKVFSSQGSVRLPSVWNAVMGVLQKKQQHLEWKYILRKKTPGINRRNKFFLLSFQRNDENNSNWMDS